jgi:hypothetical protein
MSKNELPLRERLDAMSGPMSKSAKSARVLRDDELDAVSGGLQFKLQEANN